MIKRNRSKPILLFGLSLLLLALTACSNAQANPTGTPSVAQPTDTRPPPTTNPYPSGEGECSLQTNAATTIYSLPSTEANVFSEVGAGFEIEVSGRTADSWLGFNPGIAQAGNIGPFRLRWIHLDEVSLTGNCVAVEEFWAPQPGICYATQFDPLNVYATPFPGSAIIATLNSGDFAAFLGIVANEWALVDLGLGSTDLTGLGWVESSQLFQNGSCDLPTLGD